MHDTLTRAVAAVRDGTTTSARLVDDALAAADARDGELGTFLARFDDEARAAAQIADAAVAAGGPLGPLHGVPVGIKDVLAARGADDRAEPRLRSVLGEGGCGRRGPATRRRRRGRRQDDHR